MKEKDALVILDLIRRVIRVFFRKIKIVSKIARLEANLTMRAIIHLIALSFLLRSLLTVTWFFICALCALLLAKTFNSLLIGLSIVTGSNIFLLFGVLIWLVYLKNALGFAETKQQIKSLLPNKEILHGND